MLGLELVLGLALSHYLDSNFPCLSGGSSSVCFASGPAPAPLRPMCWGSSRKWPKHLSPCPLFGRPGWSSRFLASAWCSLGSGGHLESAQLMAGFSLSPPTSLCAPCFTLLCLTDKYILKYMLAILVYTAFGIFVFPAKILLISITHHSDNVFAGKNMV